jgi:seryl-tRNA synthetase
MNQKTTQFLTPEESYDVEKALLSQSEKFLTRLTISSYRLLQIISQDLETPLAQLNHEQIIAWFEKDAKIKREEGVEKAVLKW